MALGLAQHEGWVCPATEGYYDQPYVVRTNDGAWLCLVTIGVGHEGRSGQHLIAACSTDQERTWLEPGDKPCGVGRGLLFSSPFSSFA